MVKVKKLKYREKLMEIKSNLKKVFYQDDYYVDATLAAFASRSHLCLLGFRGGGKTHLSQSLIYQIDSNAVAEVQGYLTADFTDTIARFEIPPLLRGEEKVRWYKVVNARIKFFDEIQRLGVGARNALFRLLTEGTVIYGDKEEGVKDDYFWVLATANPTETRDDVINIPVSEPLWDRFYAVLWVSMPKLKYLLKIDEHVEQLKRQFRESESKVLSEDELLELWKEVDEIEVPANIDYIATLMIRIMQFCKHCQDYDSTSIDETVKRELCSKCNQNYICSQIARACSVRAKLAWLRLAKGFAYLRGSTRVEMEDLEKAFPAVFWKKIKFMDEHEIANRLKRLRELFEQLKMEVNEAKEAIELVNKLKESFNEEDYRRLEEFVNSKVWLIEVKEDLDSYYEAIYRELKQKYDEAKNKKDYKSLIKIVTVAKNKLPSHLQYEFKLDIRIKVKLTPKTLAKLASIDKDIFMKARELYKEDAKELELYGEDAIAFLKKTGNLGDET